MTLVLDAAASSGDAAPGDRAAPVFRVDKFVVPTASLLAFIAKMHQIQAVVRQMPGCVRDLLLQQSSGAGEFNVVRIIEWADAASVETALAAMQKRFKEEGFDPTAFFVRELGARTDFGMYRVV
jgi:hypothetical protein